MCKIVVQINMKMYDTFLIDANFTMWYNEFEDKTLTKMKGDVIIYGKVY